MNAAARLLRLPACVLVATLAASPLWGQEPFDLLITGGRLVDGTGNPWRRADVGIRGEKIVSIGALGAHAAKKTIDAGGMVVAPGFIDTHTHCDGGLAREGSNINLNYLSQGVTTVVTGNCGSGTFRVRRFGERLSERGLGTNCAHLMGYSDLREEVLGDDPRAPTPDQLEQLCELARQAMREGAFGMSTGLEYAPCSYASTEELIAVASAVAEFSGVYMSHQRDEFDGVVEATLETIRIGREAGLRVLTSHFKACGKDNWGSVAGAIEAIARARAEGLEVFADQYPYDKPSVEPLIDRRSNRGWSCFQLPDGMEPFGGLRRELRQRDLSAAGRAEIEERFMAALAEALADSTRRAEIREATLVGTAQDPSAVARAGWDSYGVVSSPGHPELQGRVLSDVAREQERDAFDLAAELALAEPDMILTSGVMSPEDVRHIMVQPWLMISSDGDAFRPVEPDSVPQVGHPRSFGSQVRVLSKYVREEGHLSLEEAVRKMTSLPASFLELEGRGLLVPGHVADIVIFDPQTVDEGASFLDARRYCAGVREVIIAGKLSIEGGAFSGALNGALLLSFDKD